MTTKRAVKGKASVPVATPAINGSRVFIVQRPRPKADGWVPNFQAATKYGTLHFVFDIGDRAFNNPDAAMLKARTVLSDFNPDTDYILNVGFGDPMCGVVVDWLMATRFGVQARKVQYLYWNRTVMPDGQIDKINGYYVPLPVRLVPETTPINS